MAINDTPWIGAEAAKLYLQSGQFTSTLKTSESIGVIESVPAGITYDGTNTPWTGNTDDKLYLTSGQFTSTLKTSVDVNAVDAAPTGISWDGTNTPLAGFVGQKLFIMSGQFTTTVKSSVGISAVDTEPHDISIDGTNTPWAGIADDKLYLQSGQLTSTLKTSEAVGAVDTEPQGISFDGTNTPWAGNAATKLYLQSGQFTSTLKTSQGVVGIDNSIQGICTNDVNSRLASPDTTGDTSFILPVFSVNASVSGGNIQLPILTIAATGNPDPFATLGTFDQALPILTLASQSGFGNHVGITLPVLTADAGHFIRGNVSIILPRPVFNTVVQQGSVEEIDLDLPVFTLNAFSGHPVGLTLPQFTIAAEGSNGYVGTFSKSLPRMTVNVKASQQNVATFIKSLPQFNLNLTGSQGIVSSSVGNRTLPIFDINAHAYRGENGNVSVILPILTLTNEVALNPNGTASNSLFMLTLDAFADVYTNRII